MALEPYAPNPKQTSLDVPPPRHGFTMQDFRLFNHFKSDSHPFHPIGNEKIWTHEVPSISHKVGFVRFLKTVVCLKLSRWTLQNSRLSF